ncbi:MAG: flavin reductase family protein [Bacteroidales bacterium]
MDNFRLIDPKSLQDNVFRLLDDDWMLVTAGEPDYFNTMTASWGGFGIFWNRPVGIAMVRPQRYTRKFIDSYPSYSISFFDEKFRKALEICGSKSGRVFNKVEESGLTPALTEEGNMYFIEARLVLECRKLYQDDFHEHLFSLPEIPKNFYPSKDFHRFYIGEITHAWEKIPAKK